MKLERLSLINCGGFEQIDIDFEKDVTLIAGVNGVGKSTILHFIAVLLSKSNRRLNLTYKRPLKFDKDALFIGAMIASAKLIFDIAGRKLIAELNVNQTRSRFEKFDLIGSSDNLTRQNMLSVLYTPNRRLSGRPRALPETRPLEPSIAFDSALHDCEVELRDFMYWFRAQEKLGTDNDERRLKILNTLRSVVSELIPEFTNLRIQESPRLGFFVEKSGKPFYLHQLSDGERGLLALVFDLTRRLAIANPESDNPIAEGVALVLIDEIELHLHPKWQRRVIRKLQDIFKNCQFVITTHSPQVIGQVKAEKLRLLSYDESGKVALCPVSQAFGMDSSWVLQNIMGVPARDYETEQKLMNLYNEIDSGDYQKARKEAQELRSEIGDFPDLQEAIALLDRVEMLGQG